MSTSRSRTSTPVKAITSTLAARAAPSIPPAAQLYDSLPKGVLRHRLVSTVFLFSALSSWILTASWTTWQKGGIDKIGLFNWATNWFAPSTLIIATFFWAAGAIPVAVLRKVYISASPTPSVSPKETFQLLLAQPRTRRSLLVLSASSIALTALHSVSSYAIELDGRGDPRLGLWARSTKHPLHINGRLLFIFVTQLVAGFSFWLRDVLKDRFAVKWSRHVEGKINMLALTLTLAPALVSMLILALFSMSFATIAFGAIRSIFFPIVYQLPVVHSLLRPFVAHFMRPKYTLTFLWTHSDLIVRAYFLNVTSMFIWEVTSTLLDVCLSLPVRVTDGVKDRALVLISGMHSTDPYLQRHAIHELVILSSEPVGTARGTIYSDTKYNPSMWSSLVRQSLLLLGKDYQLFRRRGQPPPVTAPPAAPPPKLPEKPSTPIIHKPIYKSAQSSPLSTLVDSIASDGRLTQAVQQTTDEVVGVPELFLSVASTLSSPGRFFSSPPVASSSKAVVPAATTSGDTAVAKALALKDQGLAAEWVSHARNGVRLVGYVVRGTWWKDSGLSGWWTTERKNKVAVKCLPNKDLDAMIVELLTNFISHSLSEDSLGVVQRDIPRVLEALLSFLTALEAYQTELNATYSKLMANENDEMSIDEKNRRELLRVDLALASGWIEDLASSLRTGIGLVVRTFGDRLMAYRFPQDAASRLQAFVDFS
ncbi:hypothetical protein BD410DRAFT_899434 [Rickenella mellea]|uniref:Nucleoporin protein Ndc1-Nup n=1 Tax=Rickenella mellea TaxID=50990 RepID=A0A4Y7PZT1_9AGAM|nr:hypothetical protein BD410DRAFT_899434 [Rickenella mellea]